MLSDKTILITGANDGIGLATARRLAALRANLVLACRDARKGQATVDLLQEETGNSTIELLVLDLADLESVRRAAIDFLAEHPKLDVLINNAGVYTDQLQLTTQGYEYQFGVNHLGHFLLTKLLLPALRCPSEGGRIINVSSDAHFKCRINFDRLRGEEGQTAYRGMRAYACSKLANVLFTKELARRFPEELSVNALHPGVVATDFANKGGGRLVRFFWNLYKPFALTPKRGANTSVYLATSPEVRDVSGRYFDKSQCLRRPSAAARDEQMAARLWTYSEKAVADYLQI
ncbi:MAG: SDR family oxidoreductase [Bacteroidota bacterium]